MQWSQDPNHGNVSREASRHFRKQTQGISAS